MYAIFLYPLYGFIAYVSIMASAFAVSHFVPSTPPIVGFIARSMIAYLALIICAFYGTVASAVLKPLGLEYKYAQWTTARAFKYVGKALIGVDFEIVDGGERFLNRPDPVVIVGNHQTELDILMLGSLFPLSCSVTAKSSLRRTPILGWFMSLSGTVWIDRVDRNQAMKAFEGAAKAMSQKRQKVFIFPEGTRSYAAEPTLLPFKKGAFHLAIQAQVDVLPIVSENYSRILNVKAKRFSTGKVRIKVLEPISTKGKTAEDVNGLVEECRTKMLEALVQMSTDSEAKTESSIAKKAL